LGQRVINIELAISAYEQSLKVTTREAMPIEWARTMNNLANAYSDRIHGDRAQNLENAITALNQSLHVRTRETMPVEWAQSMHNLADAYSDRIKGDRAQNLEDAIAAYRQALQVTSRENILVEWAITMNNLALAYSNRIKGDRAQNLEDAIDACKQALQVRTREAMPANWAVTMNNLANAYSDRIKGDRARNLEDAIDAYKQALQVTTREAMPANWATTTNNLADAYAKRLQGDRAQNLEDAITAYKQALQVRTRKAMPIDWAITMNNLAIAYSDRIQGDRAQNLEDAITAYQQALQVRTRDAMPVDWAITMNNLAAAYAQRIRGDRAQNLEDAIAAYQQSLQVTTRDAMPIKWAESMNNLAAAYYFRVQGDRAQNLEDAIAASQQSLQVMTREAMPVEWAQSMNNLANAYADRIRGDRAQNLEDAIAAYQQSLEIFKPELLPADCRRTARLLGNLYADNQRWANALAPYETALEAAELLYQASFTRGGQEAELSEANDLFRRAAYAQARSGDLEKAVVTAEVGRARGLSESLERDRTDLTALATDVPELYQQYQQTIDNLRQLEVEERSTRSQTTDNRPSTSEAELRQRAETVRQDLKAAILAIREVPGYESFLDQPTFEDIAAAVQSNQPLVYLLPTPNGSLALVIYQSSSGQAEVSSLWLDSLTETSLQEHLTGNLRLGLVSTIELLLREYDPVAGTLLLRECLGWFGAYNKRRTNHNAWLHVIDQITRQLWDLIMEPIVTHLQGLDVTQAVLIPTGYLGFLPLHAAWTEDATTPTGRRYALDAITFTYAPNARSLQAARAVAENTAARSLLAINEPRPTTASPLPSSKREVEVAIDYFQESHRVLQHEQATRDAVLAELPNHDLLHFSCHGYANFASPLDSGLLMANDEVLSLRDFFNTDLQGVRLAILSACETGLPGIKLPDEVVSLPTGLLQAGVAGIAASLWSVADLSTMMLLVRFYDYWQNDKLEPDEALRKAQQWVRDTSNGEKEAYFRGFIPELSVSRVPYEAASELYQSLAFSDSEANDVAHPFCWAAFTYVGA
jgi:CHAT domain-containing protein/inhibitor of KinA sporulation pathway (predicted exonuclease)